MQCTPRNRDPAVAGVPFAELTSGYIVRALDAFPRQGSQGPVAAARRTTCATAAAVRRAPMDDPALEFSRAAPADRAAQMAA